MDFPFGFAGYGWPGQLQAPTQAPMGANAMRHRSMRNVLQSSLDAYLRNSLEGGGFQGVLGIPEAWMFGSHHGPHGNGGGNPPPPDGGQDPGTGGDGSGTGNGTGNMGNFGPINLLYPPPIGTGAQWRNTMKYGA